MAPAVPDSMKLSKYSQRYAADVETRVTVPTHPQLYTLTAVWLIEPGLIAPDMPEMTSTTPQAQAAKARMLKPFT